MEYVFVHCMVECLLSVTILQKAKDLTGVCVGGRGGGGGERLKRELLGRIAYEGEGSTEV